MGDETFLLDFAQACWNPLAVVGAVLVFRLLLARGPRWPRIPVFLFVLYGLLQPTADILGRFGLFPLASRWFGVAATMVLTWAVLQVVLYLAMDWSARVRGREPPAKVVRDLVRALVFAATGLVVLRTRGQVNLAGLLTTSAVFTAVIGLASQTVLSSFFAGIALQIERPFSIGDWIEVDAYIGRVIGITWRSTRLLDRRNRVVYLPNASMAASRFRVYTRPDPWYTAVFSIPVARDAPPNRVRAVATEVLRRHSRVLPLPPPEVRLDRFEDFSAVYEIRFPLDDCAGEPRVLAELRNDLWYAFRRAGLRIPFPVRDVRQAHVERKRERQDREQSREALGETLARVPILAPLTEAERDRLVRGGCERLFGIGEPVIVRGRAGRAMYIVLSGRCEVVPDETPDASPIATLGPGDCFGEMSLLTGAPCNATVRAGSDTVVFEIRPPLFAEILQARPETAERLAALLEERQDALQAWEGARRPETPRAGSLLGRIRAFFNL